MKDRWHDMTPAEAADWVRALHATDHHDVAIRTSMRIEDEASPAFYEAYLDLIWQEENAAVAEYKQQDR